MTATDVVSRLLSIDEVIAELREVIPRFSRASLYQLIDNGQIETVKIGHRRLFPPDAAGNYLRRVVEEAERDRQRRIQQLAGDQTMESHHESEGPEQRARPTP